MLQILVTANNTAVNIFIPRSEIAIYPYKILTDIANSPPKNVVPNGIPKIVYDHTYFPIFLIILTFLISATGQVL